MRAEVEMMKREHRLGSVVKAQVRRSVDFLKFWIVVLFSVHFSKQRSSRKLVAAMTSVCSCDRLCKACSSWIINYNESQVEECWQDQVGNLFKPSYVLQVLTLQCLSNFLIPFCWSSVDIITVGLISGQGLFDYDKAKAIPIEVTYR